MTECVIADCDTPAAATSFCGPCWQAIVPAVDRPIVTSADDPVDPLHYCEDCGAEYHGHAAAAQCCGGGSA